MSESQYYRFDLDSNYQYKANGVPKIRLQPQLSDSLVIAPYATILALDYSEKNAVSNLEKIAQLGGTGRYGYYEALDFNTTDPTAMTQYAVIKSFMAHHQGMNIVSINNYINNKVMVRRFHNEPIIQATEVILEQIRQSHFVAISRKGYNIQTKKAIAKEPEHISRYVNITTPEIPVAHYISNNNYSMMITSDGDGFSEYKGVMINRWRSDLYANTGNYTYIKDLSSGRYWSNTYNPTRIEPDEYQAIFSRHQAEFKRRDKDISTDTRVSISPVHNVEIRKITLINHSREEKDIEITSYIEVVADRFMAELSHPAFNKLFIENDYHPEYKMLTARRRSSTKSGNPFIIHSIICNGNISGNVEFENDRKKFIGRNNTLQNPDAITGNNSLSGSTNFSGDPILSLRIKITLKGNETKSIAFLTGLSQDRDEVTRVINEISDMGRIEDLFEKFRLQCELELKYINMTSNQLNAFQDLISPIFYPSKYFRGPAQNIRRNWKNQSFLWRFGVSGDWPIMLLKIKTIEEAGILSDVLKAYEFLRINQLKIDLIILVEAKHGYLQDLTDLINDMTRSLKIYEERRDRPSLFVIHSYQMVPAEIDLLYTVARVVFTENTGIYFRNIKEELNLDQM
jgi:cellobiose phosphorylase